MTSKLESGTSWFLTGRERVALITALSAIFVFGGILETRTALRRVPMTDLGVFAVAAGAAWDRDNIYAVSDWHGWHYQYPPPLAILFAPFAHSRPSPAPILAPDESRTDANTPWGHGTDTPSQYFGLGAENVRFFCIVAAWYVISVGLICFSAHALACILESCPLRAAPPFASTERKRWWLRRIIPLLVCAGSLGADLSRGQVDVLMLAFVAGALYLISLERELTAGLCLAFPATVKLFPPFLLLYPFWRRRWLMAIGLIAGLVIFLAILPSVTFGPRRSVELYRNWLNVLAKPALGHGTDTSRTAELTTMNTGDNQSLLAFIHNWKYRARSKGDRPPEAAPEERYASYAAGAAMLMGIAVATGRRRYDEPHDLLIIAGLLIGLAFVVSPIVHNYYYLMLLPLVAALWDGSASCSVEGRTGSKLRVVLLVFLAGDMLARVPRIGPQLRDIGLPLLSMIAMMGVGAAVLLRNRKIQHNRQSSSKE